MSLSLGLRAQILFRLTLDFFVGCDYVIIYCCLERAFKAAFVQ